MRSNEIYRSVPTRTVDGFTYSNVQDENIDTEGLPLRDGHIPQLSMVEIKKPEPSELTVEQTKISHDHGRSSEVRFGQDGSIIWTDKYGNLFTSINAKGNCLVKPFAFKSDLCPSGYGVYGLQDSSSLLRVMRASQLLRAENVDTEWILKVIEPQTLPYKGGILTLAEFKDRMVRDAAQKKPPKKERKNSDFHYIPQDEIVDLSDALDKETFLITIRGTRVAERMSDFLVPKTKDEFRRMARRVFQAVNLRQTIMHISDKDYEPWYFDAEDEESIYQYFTLYLPGAIGVNYAKLHNLGLVHGYAHSGNILATGGICDLDSVRGESLGFGDTKVTSKDIYEDFGNIIERKGTFSGIVNFIKTLQRKGYIPKRKNAARQAMVSLYYNYSEVREYEEILPNIFPILGTNEHFARLEKRESFQKYYSRLIDELGWKFEREVDLKTEHEEFCKFDETYLEERVLNLIKDIPASTGKRKTMVSKALSGKINSTDKYEPRVFARFLDFYSEKFKRLLEAERSDELADVSAKFDFYTYLGVVMMLTSNQIYKMYSLLQNSPEHKELPEKEEERKRRISEKYS